MLENSLQICEDKQNMNKIKVIWTKSSVIYFGSYMIDKFNFDAHKKLICF